MKETSGIDALRDQMLEGSHESITTPDNIVSLERKCC